MPLIKWPIEPTVFYVYSWYATNALNEAPNFVSNLMESYNDAMVAAQAKITAEGNSGVCVINPVSCVVIYPSINLETD